MFRYFMSFSALALILSSSPSFAMHFEPELPEEKKVADIHHTLKNTINTDPQLTYTRDGQTFVRGESSGDGNCMFHTLRLFFPEKEITREAFVNRLRQNLNGSAQDSEEIKEELARELFYYLNQEVAQDDFKVTRLEKLYSSPNLTPEWKGESIKNLIPTLDFFDLEGSIRKIKNAPDVLEQILEDLAEDGKMPALSGYDHLLGTFGLICKFWEINLDICYPKNSTLLTIKKYRFDKNNSFPQLAFYGGNHMRPLCDISDRSMRQRLANRMLQMVQNGEASYKDLDAHQRSELLRNSLNNQPAQEVPNINSTDNVISKKTISKKKTTPLNTILDENGEKLVQDLIDNITREALQASDKNTYFYGLENNYLPYLTDQAYDRYLKALSHVKNKFSVEVKEVKNTTSPILSVSNINPNSDNKTTPLQQEVMKEINHMVKEGRIDTSNLQNNIPKLVEYIISNNASSDFTSLTEKDVNILVAHYKQYPWLLKNSSTTALVNNTSPKTKAIRNLHQRWRY